MTSPKGSGHAAYGVGAIVGAFAAHSWHSAVLVIPLVIIAGIWLCARLQPEPQKGKAR